MARDNEIGTTTESVRCVVGGGGPLGHGFLLPRGSRVRFLGDPSGGRWVWDGPFQILPQFWRHDAIHYGVSVPASAVRSGPIELPSDGDENGQYGDLR